MLEWLQLRHYKSWRQGHLQRHDLSTEFHKNLQIGSKVDGGGGGKHPERIVLYLSKKKIK
jgi:hypothetical protein